MRTLLKVTVPVETGNRAIKDGSLPATIRTMIETQKPEASYFYAENGKRTMLFVFEMKDASQIPVLAEPLFQTMNADVQFYPVMDALDLKTGLAKFSGRRHGRAGVEV